MTTSTVTRAQTIADLRAAATVQRERGWTRGTYLDRETGRVCASGAIRTAIDASYYDDPTEYAPTKVMARIDAVLDAACGHLGGMSLSQFNDTRLTSAAEAAALLEAAAAELETVGDSAVPVPPPGTAEGRPSDLGTGRARRPGDGAPGGSAAGLRFGGPRNPAPPAFSTAGGATLRLSPAVWLQQPEFAGTQILDPDGWRDGTPFDQPLDHDEFVRRLNRCTITQDSHRPAASALSGTEVRDASPAATGNTRGVDSASGASGGAIVGKGWPPATAQPAPGAGGPGQAHPVRPPQSLTPFFAAADGESSPSDAPASPPDRGGGPGGDVTRGDFDAHVDRAFTVGGFPLDPLGPRLVEPAPRRDPALDDGGHG